MSKSLKNPKVFIVIPAFNESESIELVIKNLIEFGHKNIIVVDDGSIDNTFEILKKLNVTALRHIVNRGKGAATQTGIDAAKILGADIIVSFDADGQHYAEDINNLIAPIIQGNVDLVIGNRIHKQSGMPFYKKIINIIASITTLFFYGIWAVDSQSGLRAYSRNAVQRIETKSNRYEFESEVLREVRKHKIRFTSRPIRVQYTSYSKTRYNNLSDFQPQNIFNGIKMFINMAIRSIS